MTITVPPFLRCAFAATAATLCLNFGGCAVAITKDGVLVVVGGDVSPLQRLAEQHTAQSTIIEPPTRALSAEEQYIKDRDRDPLYQDGLRTLRDMVNHVVPEDYDELRKNLRNLQAITKHPHYFSDALMASGIMAIWDPEQAVEDQFGRAVASFVGLFLEKGMARTLIAIANDSSVETASKQCEKGAGLRENILQDLGFDTADILDNRVNPILHRDYSDACRSHTGGDAMLLRLDA